MVFQWFLLLEMMVFQWFPVVANHWSTDGMVTIHRYGLMNIVQTRASKAEEEVAELVTKAQRLEVELDKCKEQLTTRLLFGLNNPYFHRLSVILDQEQLDGFPFQF